jgi:transposase-like protein
MNLTDPIFHDDNKAREHLEAQRWPDGPYCPHCGEAEKVTRLQGETTKPGTCVCKSCRRKFTVTVGTLFESSHIGLAKWMLAFRLMASSKKGISANQLHRTLGVTYKTAWFMAHRIREAMTEDGPAPLGGERKYVEADETYIGGKETNKKLSKRKPGQIGGVGKQVVFALVERGGRARSFHVANVTGATLAPVLRTQVHRNSILITDEAGQYRNVEQEFARHGTVNHGKDEYVRGDAYSNTAEGFFAILKRGIYGTFHHVSEAHLKRYLAEFDFRYSYRSALAITDAMRADEMLKATTGKRLTYRRPRQAAYA